MTPVPSAAAGRSCKRRAEKSLMTWTICTGWCRKSLEGRVLEDLGEEIHEWRSQDAAGRLGALRRFGWDGRRDSVFVLWVGGDPVQSERHDKAGGDTAGAMSLGRHQGMNGPSAQVASIGSPVVRGGRGGSASPLGGSMWTGPLRFPVK